MRLRSEAGKLPFRPGHIVITLFAVALASIAVLVFNQVVEQPPAERAIREAPRVVVADVVSRDIELEVETIGRIVPWREVELAPEVSGRVQEVTVEIGVAVAAGEPLLRIDPGPYEDTLAERHAASLRAEARLEEARASLDRIEVLRQRGAISEREYEAAVATAGAAEADLRAAQAAQGRARRQLDDTTLRAPFAGTIVERNVDPGALVGPERPVVRLAQLDTVAVEVGLTERELLRARQARYAVIEAASLPGQVAGGTIDGVSERADPQTGTYEVRIRVDNRDEPRFLGGMVVDVRIPWRRLADATVVPAAAIVDTDGDAHVFVVRDGLARRVPVEVVAREGGMIAVGARGDGLDPERSNTNPADGPPRWLDVGDQVVVVGQPLLSDGVAVTVMARR